MFKADGGKITQVEAVGWRDAHSEDAQHKPNTETPDEVKITNVEIQSTKIGEADGQILRVSFERFTERIALHVTLDEKQKYAGGASRSAQMLH